jgi:hypothetical protein
VGLPSYAEICIMLYAGLWEVLNVHNYIFGCLIRVHIYRNSRPTSSMLEIENETD